MKLKVWQTRSSLVWSGPDQVDQDGPGWTKSEKRVNLCKIQQTPKNIISIPAKMCQYLLMRKLAAENISVMKSHKVAGLIPILICVAAILHGCSYYYEHNPRLAIASASEFCDAAFVSRDFVTAYDKLTPSKSTDFTLSSFVEMVNSMHPDGIFPTRTKPIGYEIIPGQGLINVDLKGQLPDRSNYYRIVLSLDRSKAYVITALYRRDDLFEKSGFYKDL